ncbi:MAG: hypothetical protein V1670_03155 [Candidatus Omnitrophota bacterium]
MRKQNQLINCQGISIVEYSLLIAVTAAALIGAQVLLKRAVSGYWRQSGNTFGFGRQYGGNQTSVSDNAISTTITTTVTRE